MTLPAATSHARIATPQASRYLQQLCKHFAHKLPVSFDPAAGQISFPFGEARLRAEEGALLILAAAGTAEDLARLQEVVGSHLLRFAFRDDLTIDWQAA